MRYGLIKCVDETVHGFFPFQTLITCQKNNTTVLIRPGTSKHVTSPDLNSAHLLSLTSDIFDRNFNHFKTLYSPPPTVCRCYFCRRFLHLWFCVFFFSPVSCARWKLKRFRVTVGLGTAWRLGGLATAGPREWAGNIACKTMESCLSVT